MDQKNKCSKQLISDPVTCDSCHEDGHPERDCEIKKAVEQVREFDIELKKLKKGTLISSQLYGATVISTGHPHRQFGWRRWRGYRIISSSIRRSQRPGATWTCLHWWEPGRFSTSSIKQYFRFPLDVGFRSHPQHVTGNPDLIFNLRSCSVAPMLKAGGTSHRLYGKWFVLFRFPNGQIKSIEYVLYVPASSAIFSLLDVSLIKATP